MKWFLDTEFYERSNGWGGGKIDLISIGLVSSTGLEYYAENSAFSWSAVPADDWLQENVRPRLTGQGTGPATIKRQILALVGPQPEFWGWYCDYDWVVFCWLFGRMVDLPQHFPMFCRDLKQLTKDRHIDAATLPKQAGTAHNALDDARWNKLVWETVK